MKYLSLDLEMTGFEPGWHEIIQIGAVMLDENFEEIAEFETNVYPENEESFSSRSEQVHNLSMAELDDAPMLYEALEDFEKWVKKVNGYQGHRQMKEVAICGQSVINDINFLRFGYRKEKMNWPFSYQSVDLHNISFYFFKLLEENGKPVPKYRNLDAIGKFFGFEREGDHHNALEDARLTAWCLREIFDYIPKFQIQD